MKENNLGTNLWTHKERIGIEVLSSHLPNTNELDIMSVFLI